MASQLFLNSDPSAPLINPIWAIRFFPFATLLCVGLAMFAFKTGPSHDFCLGLAFGLLVGACASVLSIQRVEFKNNIRKGDIESLQITR